MNWVVKMFEDRKDAGQKLAKTLHAYQDEDPIVLAIPRGGVEVGFYVAKYLNCRLAIVVARKLPFPHNPEAGFGAVAEDGSTFMFGDAAKMLPLDVIKEVIKEQTEELKRLIAVLRNNKPLPDLKGETVILVDDGIAMGSTMRVAIMLCKDKKAKTIIVASPVASQFTADDLAKTVDKVIILERPAFFRAVAQVYVNWYDVGDEQVLRIMKEWQDLQHSKATRKGKSPMWK